MTNVLTAQKAFRRQYNWKWELAKVVATHENIPTLTPNNVYAQLKRHGYVWDGEYWQKDETSEPILLVRIAL